MSEQIEKLAQTIVGIELTKLASGGAAPPAAEAGKPEGEEKKAESEKEGKKE